MEKQTIIRGVAIAVAGIAASIFGAQTLMNSRGDTSPVAQISAASSTAQVRSAGLIGGNIQTSAADDAALKVGDASFTALTADAELASDTAVLDFAMPVLLAEDTFAQSEPDCTPRLTAHPAIDALIEVSLSAPCHPQERLIISHGDLAFSAFTSDSGSFSTYLPAFDADGKVDLFLGDDIFLQAQAPVPDVDAHIRIALQWVGDADFALHAYHMGAQFGEAGHVHALKPFDNDLDEAFLISLGDTRGPEPMLAEVYSIPAHLAGSSRVELSLDFTAQECGREMSAYILQTGGGAGTKVNDASFSTPDCPTDGGALIMPLSLPAAQTAQFIPAEGAFLSATAD